VKVKGHPAPKAIKRLEGGIMIDAKKTLPCKIKTLRLNQTTTILTVTLREGRKHQIKRMFAAIGCPVKNLRRIAIGPLRIDRPILRKGTYRRLTDSEIKQILSMVRGS
jgi:pseudouridine synthase